MTSLRELLREMEAPQGKESKPEPIARPRPHRQRIRPAVASKPGRQKKQRAKLSRTFNRTPAPWLQAVLNLPELTADGIFRLRHDELNLSRQDAARILRVNRNTIWDWESGTRRPPFSAYLALRVLADNAKRSVFPIVSAEAAAPDAAKLAAMLEPEGRFGASGRVRQLEARMRAFNSIYSAAWLVRDSWFGPTMRRQEKVWGLVNALVRELRETGDHEALLYALADSLTCSPHGVPWKDGSELAGWRLRSG